MSKLTRLTKKFPIDNFNRCQLCGYESSDICEFRMYQECDENDKPEPYNVLIVCRQNSCRKAIENSPTLYMEVPWGKGAPGHFMLLCGNCPFRKNTECSHPDLKLNGGNGLEVKMHNSPMVHVCFSNGSYSNDIYPSPMTWCAGNPTRK